MIAPLPPAQLLPVGVVLAGLLVLTGLLLDLAGLRARGRARLVELLPALLVALVAVALAATRPPAGPAVLGLVAGALAASLGLWVCHPCGQTGLAVLAALPAVLSSSDAAVQHAVGVAAGAWIMVWAGRLPAWRQGEEVWRDLPAAVWPTLAAAGAAFGAVRGDDALPWVAPLGVLLLAIALAAGQAVRGTARGLLRRGLAVALVLALGPLLGVGFRPGLALLFGIVAGWLLAGQTVEPTADWRERLGDGLLAAGAVVVTGGTAFAVDRGLGLVLVAAGLAGALASDDEPGERAAGGLALTALTVWVLFRLCAERLPLEARRTDLYLNTPLLGLLVGLLGPLAAACLGARGRGGAGFGSRLELAVISLAALATPAVAVNALWGQAAATGVLPAGLVLAVLVLAVLPAAGPLPAEVRGWLAWLPVAGVVAAAIGLPLIASFGATSVLPRAAKSAAVVVPLLVAWLYARRLVGGEAGEEPS